MTTTTDALSSLPIGREQMFSGSDPKDGWPVTASVVHRGDGMFDIEACWVGDRAAGIETFTLRRTFTKARYAAEWLDGHLRAPSRE
tara:strand:- start:35 stop:292 length:258 start_codon:yes stop_codon:yes gene_type:complete